MDSPFNLPEVFLEHMKTMLTSDLDSFLQSLESLPPTSIRLNPKKRSEQFDNEEPVPWCRLGHYLKERPSFTFDPLFHAGAYYVQEASSMFIEQVWNAIPKTDSPLCVLDLCAAPGGKSTHLLSLLDKNSLLVSNEIIANRNAVLRENITKWGCPNSVVTQNKPEDFTKLASFFDVVFVDAPCSGEGMFRKDKNARAEWSEQNVAMCATRQTNIIEYAINCLKPGGFLVYSTCTFEPKENDNQIELALEKYGVKSIPLQFDGVQQTSFGLQFFPHKNKGEGFYIALMQKQESESSPHLQKTKKIHGTTDFNKVAAEYLDNASNFILLKKGTLIFALPKATYPWYQQVQSQLFVKQAGILLGENKGENFIPAHSLALSIHLNHTIPRIELTKDQAIAFLKCESVRIEHGKQGWAIVTFQNHALGWIKIMQNRNNNYYPKEWRILKDRA